MQPSRREFIKSTAGGATLVASGFSLPHFLARAASACQPERDDRILVIVQLTGGNDGLNTVVPHRNDAYRRARPTLGLDSGVVLPLDDDLGLNPEMSGFKQLFDDGMLNVINNVGYPNPDRSHFRSMDIWHTATTEPEDATDGWLGRVAAMLGQEGEMPPALHIGNNALPRALQSASTPLPSIRSIDAFRLDDEDGALAARLAATSCPEGSDLQFVQRVALSSCAQAQRLEQIGEQDARGFEYPSYRLAGRLRQIAQLIAADFGPRVYYASLDGFDTHARQELSHGPLLRELSDSLKAFYDDLGQRGLARQVLTMTFSEFGRRVDENASRGTDHGAGAPMFVVGPSCRPGITGGMPDLTNLTDGDVRYDVDFRRVYASILNDWLAVDARPVLGRAFDALPVIQG